jgi:hypothetical protein
MSCIEVADRVLVTEAAQQCLRDTGAIRLCARCGDRFLAAQDEAAEQRAYERAAHLWKAGLRGFEGLDERQVAAAVASALAGAAGHCRCG